MEYFFTKDKIDKGDVDLKYCPRERMWSDVLTKPQQGEKFRKIRSMLMNCTKLYKESPKNNINPVNRWQEEIKHKKDMKKGHTPQMEETKQTNIYEMDYVVTEVCWRNEKNPELSTLYKGQTKSSNERNQRKDRES